MLLMENAIKLKSSRELYPKLLTKTAHYFAEYMAMSNTARLSREITPAELCEIVEQTIKDIIGNVNHGSAESQKAFEYLTLLKYTEVVRAAVELRKLIDEIECEEFSKRFSELVSKDGYCWLFYAMEK